MVLDDSEDGLGRVRKIVADLSSLSRSGANNIEKSNLNQALESILGIAHYELKHKEVVKEFGNIPLVECMPSRLNQVFINLLVNAVHATEEKGKIFIRTWKGDECVHIEIEDTGKGIEPVNVKRIFDPFFTTKAVGKGTGLGLSLSYGIIEKHGGSIGVKSTLGEGTCFTIKLPICCESEHIKNNLNISNIYNFH